MSRQSRIMRIIRSGILHGLVIALSLASATVLAAGGGEGIKQINVNIHDQAALQRGARVFVDSCLSCHSAAYMRYNRLAEDLGLSEDQVREYFIPDNRKIGATMTVSMSPEEGEAWFGIDAPDLSVIGRSRTPSWLYSYMTSFYRDATGNWNNIVFPDVAMPHVLWDRQGIQEAVFEEVEDAGGIKHKKFSHFEMVEPGSESPEEYDRTVRDLVSYLVYMGEPARLQRESMGVWVLLFLALFTLVAYLLKVEYWKDVH